MGPFRRDHSPGGALMAVAGNPEPEGPPEWYTAPPGPQHQYGNLCVLFSAAKFGGNLLHSNN
jgi:hypothetical protein